MRKPLAKPEGGGEQVVRKKPFLAAFQFGIELVGVVNVVDSAGDVHVFSLTPTTKIQQKTRNK